MRIALRRIWESVRTSYWFVPSLMALSAVFLAMATLWFDYSLRGGDGEYTRHIYHGSAQGARSVLSTIASSMITVAGVVFSITIVSLQLASNQFGPRLLRNFMSDIGNQIVLGTFLATYLYCLLVLRATHGGSAGDDEAFVPEVSLTVGIVMAALSMGVLIYFIHHTAYTIQAPNLIAAVGRDLCAAVRREYPPAEAPDARWERDYTVQQAMDSQGSGGIDVLSRESGYLQALDVERLTRKMAGRDGVYVSAVRPGHFVHKGGLLGRMWPKVSDEDLIDDLQDCYAMNARRTHTQDPEFAVDQLVQIAVRALSPSTNDPFTACDCVDWLGSGLCMLSGRAIPSCWHLDESGKRRVYVEVTDFDGAVAAALNQIRQYGSSSAAVMIRMLEMLREVVRQCRSQEYVGIIDRHARMLVEDARGNIESALDRQDLNARYQLLRDEIHCHTGGAMGSRGLGTHTIAGSSL